MWAKRQAVESRGHDPCGNAVSDTAPMLTLWPAGVWSYALAVQLNRGPLRAQVSALIAEDTRAAHYSRSGCGVCERLTAARTRAGHDLRCLGVADLNHRGDLARQ